MHLLYIYTVVCVKMNKKGHCQVNFFLSVFQKGCYFRHNMFFNDLIRVRSFGKIAFSCKP